MYTAPDRTPRRRKRKKNVPEAAKNPCAPMRRLRANRSRIPPERKIHAAMYTATAHAIGVMSVRASSSALTLSSVVAKPMTDGVKVVPMPVACEANSCHQS